MRLADEARYDHRLDPARDNESDHRLFHRLHPGDRGLFEHDAFRPRRSNAFDLDVEAGAFELPGCIWLEQPRHVGHDDPSARDEDRHALLLAEAGAGPGFLREDDSLRASALPDTRHHVETTLADASRGRLLGQADHVRDGRLVVATREEEPGQQPSHDHQQEQDEPEPPVPLGRRADRLRHLLVCNGGGWKEPADHLVDASGTPAATTGAVDPPQPIGLPVGRQRGEALSRVGDALERSGDVGRKIPAGCHRRLCARRVAF